jgi:DNA-binding NtrC family response regulator
MSLPTLAERREDIPDLVRFFLHRYARELGDESPAIQPDALAWLQSQSWPGNVRELENVVRRALLLARPFLISLDHVQQAVTKGRKPVAISSQTHAAYVTELLNRVQNGEESEAHPKMIKDLEAELFSQAIQLAQGNQARAARWLGVTRLKMREKLTELGLHPGRAPDSEGQG